MPIYLYKGYDIASGATRKGKIEAESTKAARQKLKSRDKVIASDLKEEVSVKKGPQKASIFGSGVSVSDLAVMTRQFATLQQAHVPLDDCLKALTQQVDNAVLSNMLSAIKDSVSEGKSLAEGLSNFPQVFNRLYVNMVKAGEQSGNLDLVLERLADFIEYQVAIRGQVSSAISYPALMISASGLIVGYLFVGVIPKLEKIFSTMKVPLPWYSEVLIGFSKFILEHWLGILVVSGIIGLALRSWYRSEAGRMTVDRWSIRVPTFGPVVMRVNVSKFTKTLSTLLGSGVPIISALEITKNTIGNQTIASVVETATRQVQEGEPLWASLEKSGIFPALVVHMIQTGEKTGELEKMLSHVAKAYDAEVERKIDSLISLIEPLMIIVMGLAVAMIVVGMIVPMFSIMDQVR